MRVPTDEQETVIQFDRNGKTAIIDTTDSTVMTKLDKLVANTDNWTVKEEHFSLEHELIGKCYQTNKKFISFRSGKSQGHSMSDEQKKLLADRFHKNQDKADS